MLKLGEKHHRLSVSRRHPPRIQSRRRMASVEEIVKHVLFVASEDASFSTGSEFVADRGFALGPIAPPRS
jgi:NAD(P)-dependent dehydrogenase (short-subunit alcohol dehydrogenase family)